MVSVHHIMINFWTLITCGPNLSILRMSTEAICPSEGCLDRLRYLKLTETFQGSLTACLGSVCPSRKVCVLHSSYITSSRLVWVPQLPQITYCTSVLRCLNFSLQEPCWSLYLERILSIVDFFLPLGRPTHCGRKKKIRMDYIGIAWLKCYQLCVGTGRKGRKMPTLLVEKTQFVKFKSEFRPESRVILIKGVSTACWETKTIARLGWQEGSQSFQTPASCILRELRLDVELSGSE